MIKTYSVSKDGELKLSPHFAVKEFRPKWNGNPDGDVVRIDEELIAKLEKLSAVLKNAPIHINDGYRTPKYDMVLTGKAGQHTTGRAADIKCSGYDSAVLAGLAELIGFDGVGIINETSIHVDTRGYKKRFIENGVKSGTEKVVDTFITPCIYKLVVENKTGFSVGTINYLSSYTYPDALFEKLAKAMI